MQVKSVASCTGNLIFLIMGNTKDLLIVHDVRTGSDIFSNKQIK